MKITFVDSSVGQGPRYQYLTSFLVNDTVSIDAGCLGFLSPPSLQRQVRHVLLSHSHIDHLASLPIFLENACQPDTECVTVYASDPVLESLHNDVFNGRLWPDLNQLTSADMPYLNLERLEAEKTIAIDQIRITPVPLDHVVPCFGFIVQHPGAAVVFASDTGPTQRIWDIANETPDLKAIFMEASFPNALAGLALLSKHLTPGMLQDEGAKLEGNPRLAIVHIKPTHYEIVVSELEALGLANLEVGKPGAEYEF